MIESQSLGLIPPISGKEKLFGWYPPAYQQFSKVPYKTMAVLDDYQNYKTPDVNEESKTNEADVGRCTEAGGTVLSAKLNAIRQELGRKRIDPRRLPAKKFSCLNEYLGIPPTWKPKYPEPNVNLLINEVPLEKVLDVVVARDEKPCETCTPTNVLPNYDVIQTPSNDKQETQSRKQQNNKFTKRPFTAPGFCGKTARSHSSTQSRIVSCNATPLVPNITDKLKKASMSEPNMSGLSYENDLKKYQWLMEIPNDPFNLKQPHIPQKQPFFHAISEVKILPQEPPMKKENKDTFFYNTSSYRAISFDIHPSFTSEKYNAIKNKLKSQGKWNYSTKSFSFVY